MPDVGPVHLPSERSRRQRITAEEQARLQTLLLESQSEATLDGILVVGPGGEILLHNRRFAEMWGIPEEILATRSDDATIAAVLDRVEDPDAFRERIEWLYAHPEETGRDSIRLKDGRIFDRWSVVLERDGVRYGRAWYFRDVTAETHLAAHLAERQRRAAFLAEVSGIIAASRDEPTLYREFARAVVRFFADWCVIDLVEPSGTVERVAVAHSDPALVELARRVSVSRHYEIDPHAERGVPAVLRTGRTQYALEIAADRLDAVAGDPEHARLLRDLGFTAYISAPLVARGRILGAVTFVTASSGRRYSREDVALAEDLAHRASIALDNLRLLAERSRVARTLQESLLPPSLPVIPGAELAARYLAGGEEVVIGGDFYDVFPMARGSWAVVVGDVCGKGAEAAALTASVRHTIRAVAMQRRKPRRVLAAVNDALLAQRRDERFSTAVFARLDPAAEGFRVTLAAAGHPLPIAVSAGAARPVGAPGSLLGIFPDASWRERTVTLRSGDACVLYTDGVIDARRGDEVFGEARLRALLAGTTGADAERIVERISSAVLEFQGAPRRDDIAIVAIRVL